MCCETLMVLVITHRFRWDLFPFGASIRNVRISHVSWRNVLSVKVRVVIGRNVSGVVGSCGKRLAPLASAFAVHDAHLFPGSGAELRPLFTSHRENSLTNFGETTS